MIFLSMSSKRSRSSVKSHSAKIISKKRAKSASATKGRRMTKLSAARALANAATQGFLGIEKKFLDTARADGAVGTAAACTGGEADPAGTGCTGCLSVPAQGDGEQNCDGKKYVIDSLIIKGYVRTGSETSEAPTEANKVFVAVVLDTQTNGAQMNSEDCFKNLLNTTAGLANVTKNLLGGNRFRILKSHVFDLTPIGIAGTVATSAHYAVRREFDWYIPFKGGLPVRLNGTGVDANVANCIDNSLHVIAFSTIADSALAYNARIRFQG